MYQLYYTHSVCASNKNELDSILFSNHTFENEILSTACYCDLPLFLKKIHFDNFLNRTSSKGGWFYRRESKIRSMHDLKVQFFFLSIKLKAEANGRGGAHASDPNNVGTSLVDTTCHPLE